MKRFKFRLQTVLEQRERLENQAKSSYGQAQDALIRGQRLLQELENEREEQMKEFADLRLSGRFSPDEARAYLDYIAVLTKCIKDQIESVRHLTTTAEAFRLHLVGASQQRQVVDKLKERDKERHAQEAVRLEQIESDELVNTRFHYNKSQGRKSA